jgi:queuine tRNA-ribosyltransferase
MKVMTPQQAQAAVDDGTAVIIDVREPDEVAQAAIPGAVHIPMGDLLDRLAEVPRDRTVVFSCHSGARSESVCRYLEDNEGFADLVNLEGGIVAWHRGQKRRTTR